MNLIGDKDIEWDIVIQQQGYISLNLNAGSDPDVAMVRGKLFQGSVVREKRENLLVLRCVS